MHGGRHPACGRPTNPCQFSHMIAAYSTRLVEFPHRASGTTNVARMYSPLNGSSQARCAACTARGRSPAATATSGVTCRVSMIRLRCADYAWASGRTAGAARDEPSRPGPALCAQAAADRIESCGDQRRVSWPARCLQRLLCQPGIRDGLQAGGVPRIRRHQVSSYEGVIFWRDPLGLVKQLAQLMVRDLTGERGRKPAADADGKGERDRLRRRVSCGLARCADSRASPKAISPRCSARATSAAARSRPPQQQRRARRRLPAGSAFVLRAGTAWRSRGDQGRGRACELRPPGPARARIPGGGEPRANRRPPDRTAGAMAVRLEHALKIGGRGEGPAQIPAPALCFLPGFRRDGAKPVQRVAADRAQHVPPAGHVIIRHQQPTGDQSASHPGGHIAVAVGHDRARRIQVEATGEYAELSEESALVVV